MNRAAAILVALSVATFAPAQEPTGSVAGIVRYLGDVPPPRKIITSDGLTLHHNDLVVDANTKGLRYVAVWLDAKLKAPPGKDRAVVVDQKDMVFAPRVAAVQEGQTVRFENSDLSNHGVKASSLRPENEFDVLTPPGQGFAFKFKAARGPVLIGCQIHNWMQAYVYVLPHPYFAVTDAQGRFRIDGLPAGKHALILEHPDTKRRGTVSVEVRAGQTATVALDWREAKAGPGK